MENNDIEIVHSKKNMASFSFGNFIKEFLTMAFSVYAYFYYETEIGLNALLCGLAFVIYAVWNGINDPLVGYLTNRPFKFTKKWGRRFPWIFLGGIPWIMSYVLIFTPPNVDPQSGAWILFSWLLFTICLFDTFASICIVNYDSLFPDKFRSVDERRTVSGILVPISMFGTVLGAILPPLFITFGVLDSYILQAGIVFVVCLIALIALIPGSREDEVRINSYIARCEEKVEKDSFIKDFKTALKQKTFVAYVILFFCYAVMIRSLTASIPYVVRFVLKMDATAISLVMLAFFLGVMISVPFWIKLSRKMNDNRKVMIISGTLVAIFITPLIFLQNYFLIIITVFVWGLVEGGFFAMIGPVAGDTIDESVVIIGERKEGIYSGFVAFFTRLAIAVQAISFALTHHLTGFVEGASTQSDLAVWGIHIHMALIPMIFMLFGVLCFWRLYDLTPEKVKENQLKIKQMGL